MLHIGNQRVFPGARVRLVAIAAVGALLAIIPTTMLLGLPHFCLFRDLFGVECLGCGMVRAASCMVHGDIEGAAQFNRLVFVLVPLVCTVVVRTTMMLRASGCVRALFAKSKRAEQKVASGYFCRCRVGSWGATLQRDNRNS